MTLPGTFHPATPGLKGFDTDCIVTAKAAAAFAAQGYSFCLRYVSRATTQGKNDLSPQEAQTLLQAGLSLMAVQHVRKPYWTPTATLGTSDGVHAAYHVHVIGFPPKVNVWCDLEGVQAGTPAQQVIDYCNAWHTAVAAAGFTPGLYVGADAILTGARLVSALKFEHYWKSLSTVPALPGRGYQMIQTAGPTVAGIATDQNVTQNDTQGNAALLLK